MELYHASQKKMKVGECVVSSHKSSFYPKASRVMDCSKPDDKPARSKSLYCAEDPEFAVFFLMCQGVPIEKILLYKVEVTSFHKAPFAITHAVQRKFEGNASTEALVSEYWNPTKEWSYYEFLTLELSINGIVNIPKINEIVIRCRYHKDIDQAQNIS